MIASLCKTTSGMKMSRMIPMNVSHCQGYLPHRYALCGIFAVGQSKPPGPGGIRTEPERCKYMKGHRVDDSTIHSI